MIKLKLLLLESNIDHVYLNAVQRGDLITAQKMVDYMAKKKGYMIKAYHGSPNKFYVFDPLRGGERTNANSAKLGFFTSDSMDVAVQYKRTKRELDNADNFGPLGYTVSDAQNNLERFIDSSKIEVEFDNEENGYIAYIKTIDSYGSEYRYNATGLVYDDKEEAYEDAQEEIEKEVEKLEKEVEKKELERQNLATQLDKQRTLHNLYLKIKNPLIYDFKGGNYTNKSFTDLLKQAKEDKHDGAIFKNVNDAIDNEIISNVYIFFDSSQAKLSDPIVFDNNKNVIPLSKRFDDISNDIRYEIAI